MVLYDWLFNVNWFCILIFIFIVCEVENFGCFLKFIFVDLLRWYKNEFVLLERDSWIVWE